jgi:hypothetical protein
MTARLVVGLVAMLVAVPSRAAEVVVTVVQLGSPAPSTPPLVEVEARVAQELKQRGFQTRVSQRAMKPVQRSVELVREEARMRGEVLGIVVYLPDGVDETTLLVVVDRVTGKTLSRTLPRLGTVLASSVALAAAELVDASLVELLQAHTSLSPEVPRPVDLPVPTLPTAPSEPRWSLAARIAATWPVLLSPAPELGVALERTLGAHLRLAAELDIPLAAWRRSSTEGTVLASVPRVSARAEWDFLGNALGLEAGGGLRFSGGAAILEATAAQDYLGRTVVKPMLLAGVQAFAGWRWAGWLVRLDVSAELPLLYQEAVAVGQTLLSLRGPWFAGGVSVALRWHSS